VIKAYSKGFGSLIKIETVDLQSVTTAKAIYDEDFKYY